MGTIAFVIFMFMLAIATAASAVIVWMSPRGSLSHRGAAIVFGSSTALFLLGLLTSGIKQVSAGYASVPSLFGVPTGEVLGPKLHFINPLLTTHDYITTRREFPVQGQVQAGDANQLTVDAVLATMVNPAALPLIQARIGTDYFVSLVQPAGRTAVRDAFSRFSWTKAITSERGEVEGAVQSAFEAILRGQLVAAGFSVAEAEGAVRVLPVQLRSIVPDPKVSNAVAEKTAAQQDLERQSILTSIAQQEAQRRANEGNGVRLMFDALPQNFTAAEISAVLVAIATKTRADAMMKAVEGGHVGTIVMNGDGATQPSISLPSRALSAADGSGR